MRLKRVVFDLSNKMLRPFRLKVEYIVADTITDQTGNFAYVFLSKYINKINPGHILNIGSHRKYVLGLLAGRSITTVDLEKIAYFGENETIFNCDVRKMPLLDNSFDIVFTIGSFGYFGLGKYGDEKNQGGGKKALGEILRVLKAGGYFIFNVNFTQKQEGIIIKETMVYNEKMIRELCGGLILVEEKVYFNNYIGCYQKPLV